MTKNKYNGEIVEMVQELEDLSVRGEISRTDIELLNDTVQSIRMGLTRSGPTKRDLLELDMV